MKKVILSLATSALFTATSAHAINVVDTGDTSLDVFGRAEYKLQNGTGGNRSRSWFESRLGFTGYVDQYEGIRAFFKTSWSLQSQKDDSASNYNGTSGDNIRSRYQYVGLDFGDDAKYGTIILGQDYTPFYNMLTSATDIFYVGGMEASAGTYSNRAPNQILYSNTFGDLSMQASYQTYTEAAGNTNIGVLIPAFKAGLGDYDTFTKQDNAYSVGVEYNTGANIYLHGAYAYQSFRGDLKKTDYGMGINYYDGDFYLAGIYTSSKEEDGSQTATRKGYEIASYYVMDKVTLLAGYAYGNQRSDIATSPITDDNDKVTGTRQNDDVDYAKSITLNVAYQLFNNVSASAGVVDYRNTNKTFYKTQLTYNF